MRGNKWFICLMVVGLLLAGLVSIAPAKSNRVEIRIDCGPPGGGKNFRNECLADAVRKANPGWVVTGVSGPDLPVVIGMMVRKEVEMSTTRSAQMLELRKGELAGKSLGTGPLDLRWICVSNYAQVTFYFVEKFPYNTVDELLASKYPMKVSIGPPGSDPYIQAIDVLKAFGLTFDDLKKWGSKLYFEPSGRSIKMVSDGLIEGKFHVGTVPEPAWEELSRTRPIKVLTIKSEEVIKKLVDLGYERQVIPAGTYKFTPKDVPTVGVANLVVVRADVSDDVVYNITRGIWEQREFLAALHPIFKQNLTKEVISYNYQRHKDLMHPGAVKYWKEKGLIQ